MSGHTSEVSRTLVAQAQAGDEDALRSLVELAYPRVRRWALVHLGDPADADDLTQDVLVLMLRKLETFRGDSRFGTWLYSLTRHAAVDRVRTADRRARLHEGRDALDSLLPSPSTDPADATERAELRRLLAAFFDRLPARQREAFAAVELEGLSATEAAERLGLRPVSVRAHLFKARRKLRMLILAELPEVAEDLT